MPFPNSVNLDKLLSCSKLLLLHQYDRGQRKPVRLLAHTEYLINVSYVLSLMNYWNRLRPKSFHSHLSVLPYGLGRMHAAQNTPTPSANKS